jgi:beta-galactosidase
LPCPKASRIGFVLLCFFSATLLFQLHANTPADSNSLPTQLPGHDAILVGTDWYPEQWPESRWEADVSMMEAAHLTVIRLAGFAWSRMEPSEGHYDFEWLDRAIRLAGKHHILVVLDTPSAAPPAWLTQKYPDILRMEKDGRRVTHGNRTQGSVTSARYREFCRRIAAEMARRYGHDPHVIGWQIDNEYGYSQMSFEDDTRRQFREWLKARYKSLSFLNQQWTTAYWSETYDAWDEIPIPDIPHNPGLMLDWKRFVTFAWASYQQNQIDAIRQFADPRQFITGNFMGYGFEGFDHYIVARSLTFVAWDDYVATGHLDPDTNGISHDNMRGLKRQNFWVIETQPGFVDWSNLNNSLNKGEVRAMAWHDIGHGADLVSYWQWRSALNGQEEMHGTLVAPDGEPEPLLSEVTQTAAEFAQIQNAFRGTRVVSDVALLHDYESRWAINWQIHTTRYDTFNVLKAYYHALRKISQSIDIVSPDVPLDQYKLVVAPDLNLIPKDRADHLLDYVKNGGHLVLGPRSGQKDQFNGLLPLRQPGYLAEALGGRVEQYYALERNAPVSGTLGSGEAPVWAEQLSVKAPNVEVLLTYGTSNGWLDGQPAVITRPFGKGRITYVGALLDTNLMTALADWMLKISQVAPALGPVPDGIEVNRRVGPNSSVYVLINFNPERQTVELPRPMRSLLAPSQGEATVQEPITQVELDRYGVSILLDSSKP